jgi:hypothetical protein
MRHPAPGRAACDGSGNPLANLDQGASHIGNADADFAIGEDDVFHSHRGCHQRDCQPRRWALGGQQRAGNQQRDHAQNRWPSPGCSPPADQRADGDTTHEHDDEPGRNSGIAPLSAQADAESGRVARHERYKETTGRQIAHGIHITGKRRQADGKSSVRRVKPGHARSIANWRRHGEPFAAFAHFMSLDAATGGAYIVSIVTICR